MDQSELEERVQDEPEIEDGEPVKASDGEAVNCTLFSESWIKRHHEAIIALSAIGGFLTTLVLAAFTGFSLYEVKQQRDLAFKQFVISNRPLVTVFPKDEFQFKDDIAWMNWLIWLHSGYIRNLKYKAVVYRWPEIINSKQPKILIQSKTSNSLRHGRHKKVAFQTADTDLIEWIRNGIEEEKSEIHLYLKVQYEVPPELSLSGKTTSESVYDLFMWNKFTKQYENLKIEFREPLLKRLEELGAL
jgi:hypothetical protein